MRLAVRVPATAANLGPGFDALGLALGMENEVTVETEAEPAVEIEGEGADELPRDASNLMFRSMAFLAREAGGALPSLRLTARNRIPLERGLGSSAAAVVAGLLLGDRLLGAGLGPDRLLEVAADLEGHPDNVAAALRGGLVVVYLSREGWRAERLEPHPDLRPSVLIPDEERIATEDARRVLPMEVPLRDAVFNLGRSALAVHSFTRAPELLGEALADRLHQARRLALAPKARALFEELRAEGIPVCVAGSGPTLLAFGLGERPVGPGWRVERPTLAGGAVLEEDRPAAS